MKSELSNECQNILLTLKKYQLLPASQISYVINSTTQNVKTSIAYLMNKEYVLPFNQYGKIYYSLNKKKSSILETFVIEKFTIRELPHAVDASIRFARTCYGHLAGFLGVCLANKLKEKNYLENEGNDFFLTSRSISFFLEFGLNILDKTKKRKRNMTDNDRANRFVIHPCCDWTERQFHLGGDFGLLLTNRLFELGWIKRLRNDRSVIVTNEGELGFKQQFNITVDS